MSNVFDPIRARSSVDALEMIARQHPETAINVAALREELETADEQINQLARALREAVEPPTFMGEPVAHRPIVAWFNPDKPNSVISAAQYQHVLPKNKTGYLPCIVTPPGAMECFSVRASLEKLLLAEEKYMRDTGMQQPDDLIQRAVNAARATLGWPVTVTASTGHMNPPSDADQSSPTQGRDSKEAEHGRTD